MSILKEAMWDEPGIPAHSSQRPSFWFRRLTFGRLHMHMLLKTAPHHGRNYGIEREEAR